MRERYMTVILNEKGLEEYDFGIDKSANMIAYELPEFEFEKLCESDVFKKINKECSLMIDDYESEVINKEKLKQTKSILLNEKVLKSVPVFAKAFETACDDGIALAFDF